MKEFSIFTVVVYITVMCIIFINRYETIRYNGAAQKNNVDSDIFIRNSTKLKMNDNIEYNAQFDRVLDLLDIKYRNCTFTLNQCLAHIEGRKSIFNKSESVNYLLPFPIIIKNVVESTHKCREKMELIIAITSSPNSFLERYTYRKIYNEYRSNIEYYFFVGMSINETINELIKEENEKYNDLIQFDFLSHYYNVTYQTIGSIRWINEHCKNYKYVVEHQSDVFFNMFYYFKVYGSDDKVYPVLSAVYTNKGPIRNSKSKFYRRWEVPRYIYPSDKYPAYPQGPCILFSENAMNAICNCSYTYNFVLFLDDVYLGLLMNSTGIKQYTVIHRRRESVSKFMNVNQIKMNLLWLHGVKPGFMYYIWKLMKVT